MYFVIPGGAVCHILSDAVEGTARCGVRVSPSELKKLEQGKPSAITKEQPPGIRLCKHCGGTCKHCGFPESEE